MLFLVARNGVGKTQGIPHPDPLLRSSLRLTMLTRSSGSSSGVSAHDGAILDRLLSKEPRTPSTDEVGGMSAQSDSPSTPSGLRLLPVFRVGVALGLFFAIAALATARFSDAASPTRLVDLFVFFVAGVIVTAVMAFMQSRSPARGVSAAVMSWAVPAFATALYLFNGGRATIAAIVGAGTLLAAFSLHYLTR
ncbi:MAG: hypothetical protein HUU26_06660 [Gemmatimonadaceae bacterium]|nr:hypothetical protein [Gemmatimonadaceae bacterium]